MREAPGSKQPVWNRHYSAWSQVLGADSGEVLHHSMPNRIIHQPAAGHPPHIMGTLGPHEEKRKVWWARVQFCATVTFCITMKLAKKATGSWWRELSQLHTPKHTISFSGLPWRMCRGPFVFVWQTMVIPQLFGNSRASIWTAMNGRPC